MKFDFYLSEMSVSNQHGGGLTLQRVLGDDLLQIPLFVHVSRFAEGYPTIDQLKDRVLRLTPPWDSDLSRRIIGNTMARKIRSNPFAIKNAAKNAARVLNNKFEKGKPLNVLICPQGPEAICTLEALKQYRPVKYVSWIMDDHLIKYTGGKWQYPNGMEPVFAKHLREAEQIFVISPVMQAFYRDRFGVASIVLFGPADRLAMQVQTGTLKQSLKIGYFGAVTLWQLDAMQLLVNALKGANAQLHIYSGIEKLPVGIDQDGVQLMKRLSPTEVPAAMQQYDALLLPISFMEAERPMSELNIATKMSEYLASGIPILVVGPPYAAMIKYLSKSDAAIFVESDKVEEMNKAFQALHDPAKITRILSNAQTLVLKETGTAPMRKQWLDNTSNFEH